MVGIHWTSDWPIPAFRAGQPAPATAQCGDGAGRVVG